MKELGRPDHVGWRLLGDLLEMTKADTAFADLYLARLHAGGRRLRVRPALRSLRRRSAAEVRDLVDDRVKLASSPKRFR
jgi:hypothetical protein